MSIAALVLAIGLAATPQEGPSYKIGGDTVPVQVPSWTGARPFSVATRSGATYAFLDGQLLGRSASGFEWTDVPAVPAGTAPTKQRVLFNVVARTDTLTRAEALLQTQGTIFTEDMRAIKREVALFCHLAKAMSGGKIEIEPTWRLDETLRFVERPEDLGAGYLSPFVNATSAKPAEGLGPFDAIVLLTPLFTREIHSLRLDQTPVSSIPMYAYFDRSRAGQLARAMFNGWVAAPSGATVAFSTPVGAGPIPLLDPAEWAATEHGTAPTGVDNARTIVTQANMVLVRPEVASWYASVSGKTARRQSAGWVEFEGPAPAGGSDQAVLGVEHGSPDRVAEPETAFGPGQAEKLPIGGTFAIKTSTDPDRGSVGEFKEMSIRRQGWLRVLGSFDGSTLPAVQFWAKPRGPMLPLEIRIIGDGKAESFFLFGWSRASGAQVPAAAQMLDIKAEPTWQRIRIRHSIRNVEGVYLVTPPANREAFIESLPSMLLDDASATAEVTDLTPQVDIVREDPVWADAVAAATTTDPEALLKFLGDKSDLVQLNAATRFVEIQNPAAVPALALVARHYNPRLAQAGAKALAKQGTPDALAALRYNFQNALGDFVKQFTAEVLPPIDERRILSELTLALNARRPDARAAAARCLGRQPFKEASMVMLAFLSDTDPVVRAAAITAIPERTNVTFPRVLGAARNDPSDLVREAAFAKLKEWNAPEAVEKDKDPSPRVRSHA